MNLDREKNKLNGKMKLPVGAIQDIVTPKSDYKKSFDEIMDSEKEMIDQGLERISGLTSFIKSNWKTVVPALAAVGVGAFLLSGKKTKKRATTK